MRSIVIVAGAIAIALAAIVVAFDITGREDRNGRSPVARQDQERSTLAAEDEGRSQPLEAAELEALPTDREPVEAVGSADDSSEQAVVETSSTEDGPFDAFASKYEESTPDELGEALRSVTRDFKELRARALEDKRRRGDYIEAHPDSGGFSHKPDVIPDGAIYRQIINPAEAAPDPEGRSTVWYLYLEREAYADAYALERERDWLRAQLRSATPSDED